MAELEVNVGSRIAQGREHRIYELEDGEDVIKVPSWISKWQIMTPDAAREDLGIIEELGHSALSIVPTTVYDRAVLHHQDGRLETTDYALVQPLIPHEKSGPRDLLRLMALRDSEETRLKIKDLMEVRYEIEEKTGRALDLMGGEAFTDSFIFMMRRALAAINTNVDPMNPVICNNMIVPSEDATRDGQIVANEGDMLLADVRLMRPGNQLTGWFRKMISGGVKFTHHAEGGLIKGVLDQYGNRVDSRLITGGDSPGYRFGQFFARNIVSELGDWQNIDHCASQ